MRGRSWIDLLLLGLGSLLILEALGVWGLEAYRSRQAAREAAALRAALAVYLPAASPTATPTPLPSPSPTSTSTPIPSPAAASPASPPPSPTPTSTPTPTPPPPPTPTPTPTGVPLAWIRIPVAEVDYPVKVAPLITVEVQGQLARTWEVVRYAVGHHEGTAYPGQGDNIVLAAHLDGFGGPFKHLHRLQPGDEIELTDVAGRIWRYRVREVLLLREAGASLEERIRNGRYLMPTPGWEHLTLVTCWPSPTYENRLIVLADPVRPPEDGME